MDNALIFDLSSEGEEIIKNYECTGIRKLFFGSSKGYITLTNKRILYHATGKSIKGRSLVLSEMPINDVSGIGVYMGTSINWIALIAFTLGLYIIAPFILTLLPGFFTHVAFGLLSLIPYLLMWLWEKNFLSDEVKDMAIDNLKKITTEEHLEGISFKLLDKIFSIAFVYGIFIVAMRMFSGNLKILRVIVFVFIYFKISGPIKVFSLQIHSKSAKGTGIFLPGVQKLQIFNFKTNDTTALDTLAGAPAVDSEPLIRELGAIITDLKEMGDLAISKWQLS